MKIIFRYHNQPTNNFLCTDGSSEALTLFDAGIIRYEHYLFRCDTPSKAAEFGPFPEVVGIVEKIIAQYSTEIEGYPDFIDPKSPNKDTVPRVSSGHWELMK